MDFFKKEMDCVKYLCNKNTFVKEPEGNHYELFVLNNETARAINAPESEYKI